MHMWTVQPFRPTHGVHCEQHTGSMVGFVQIHLASAFRDNYNYKLLCDIEAEWKITLSFLDNIIYIILR